MNEEEEEEVGPWPRVKDKQLGDMDQTQLRPAAWVRGEISLPLSSHKETYWG